MLGKRVPLDLAARSEEHGFIVSVCPLHDGNRPRSATPSPGTTAAAAERAANAFARPAF